MMGRGRLFYLVFAFVALLWVTSCKEDASMDVAIKEITARQAEGNVLRIPISVLFSEDCSYTISYWQKSNPSVVFTTPASTTTGLSGTTVLRFLYADTEYCFHVNVVGGVQSKDYSFKTKELPAEVPAYSMTEDNLTDSISGYLLQWEASTPGYVTFCDMKGNVVWYERFDEPIRTCIYDTKSQTLLLMTGFQDQDNYYRLCNHMIRIDLDGNKLLEWLALSSPAEHPHHDFKLLPDGNLICVNNVLGNFDLSSVGGSENDTVWGDGFTVFSPEGTIVKQWDCFPELEPLEAKDYINVVKVKDDFLHANSVNWDSNGDYYMTFNRLSELWKISGTTGEVLYRLGPHGNIQLPEEAMASGLHCCEPIAVDEILCFDNGKSSGQSRAVLYKVDAQAKTAKLTLSVKLPTELSSSDRSNVMFVNDSILLFGSTLGHAAVLTDLNGKILRIIKRTGISYRTYYYPYI